MSYQNDDFFKKFDHETKEMQKKFIRGALFIALLNIIALIVIIIGVIVGLNLIF